VVTDDAMVSLSIENAPRCGICLEQGSIEQKSRSPRNALGVFFICKHVHGTNGSLTHFEQQSRSMNRERLMIWLTQRSKRRTHRRSQSLCKAFSTCVLDRIFSVWDWEIGVCKHIWEGQQHVRDWKRSSVGSVSRSLSPVHFVTWCTLTIKQKLQPLFWVVIESSSHYVCVLWVKVNSTSYVIHKIDFPQWKSDH
jgi:hypothetical protein